MQNAITYTRVTSAWDSLYIQAIYTRKWSHNTNARYANARKNIISQRLISTSWFIPRRYGHRVYDQQCSVHIHGRCILWLATPG